MSLIVTMPRKNLNNTIIMKSFLTNKTIKRSFVGVFLLVSSISGFAQSKIEMLLYDKDPSVATDEKTAAIRANDFTRDPAITAYIPQKPNGKAIIMCPGGGYVFEATGHEGHDMAEWFNRQGITYVVLKYRLPQGNSSIPLADAEEAVRIVRDNAAEWGVDPGKIGIMGASAGGHLASTLATHYSSPATRPDFQILFYPVITMDKSYTHLGSHDFLLGADASVDLEKNSPTNFRSHPTLRRLS